MHKTTEQKIADLEHKIAQLKVEAARRQAQKSPAIRHAKDAIRSIDRALGATESAATRSALREARSILVACLAVDGVVMGSALVEPRGRRSSANVGAMASDLLGYVTQHPGQRGEQIAAALGTNVVTMRKPMKQLIAERKVKTKGQRRGMTYYAT